MPTLPRADVRLALSARIDDAENLSGHVTLNNEGAAGTLDQHRLPLRSMSGQFKGTLSAPQISEVLIDLGAAGKLAGGATLLQNAAATFALHTDRLDLKAIHSSLNATHIAGDVKRSRRSTACSSSSRHASSLAAAACA